MTATSRPPDPPERSTGDGDDPEFRARRSEYWRRNVRYVGALLGIWFLVSYGFGILLVEPLNQLTVPGTGLPLGFWFAQQGSIYVFVVLIFVYVWLMNRLDREFDVDEGDAAAEARGTGAARPDTTAGGNGPERETDR